MNTSTSTEDVGDGAQSAEGIELGNQHVCPEMKPTI